MERVFFTRVEGLNASLVDASYLYAAWVLGVETFSTTRSRRLTTGVNPTWRMADLIGGGNFPGRFDSSLATRTDDGSFILRWVHRDDHDPSIFWHNVASLAQSDKGLILEHAAALSGPANANLRPKVACPRIVKLLVQHGASPLTDMTAFSASAMTVEANRIDDWAKYVLLDTKRRTPIVIVSPRNSDDLPIVFPTTLAGRLFGLASVVTLADHFASRALTGALQRRGYSDSFGCYDGAVRIYQPNLLPESDFYDHPLFIPRAIEELPDETRTDDLAGHCATRIVRHKTPPSFFAIVDEFDRRRQQRTMETLRASAPAVNLDEALKKIEQINAVLAESNDLVNAYSRDAEEALQGLQEAVEARDRLQAERDEKSRVINDLNARLARGLATSSPANENVTKLVLELAVSATLETQLKILREVYPGRIVVLDRAFKSARDSEEFKHRERAFELLHDLATTYWEALTAGKGDTEARKCFGDHYAAGESERVANTAGAMARRRFEHDGQTIEFLPHLRIGNKDSVAETLRIHFIWDAKKSNVVIGHCGAHLDFR